MNRFSFYTSASVLAATVCCAAPAMAQTYAFDVPAQAATTGVRAFGQQANIEVVVASRSVRGRTTNPVQGRMEVRAALDRLLADTGLFVRSFDGRVAVLDALPQDQGGTIVDEVVVTGTREASRTAFESLSPVDVLSQRTIREAVSSDFNDNLAVLVPSYNVRRLPAADDQAFVRTTTLRGLPGQYVLTLVNGRRYHGSAASRAADLASIPTTAIQRTEILRDGAAAQYGSDAIAGVINIILDERPGLRAFSQVSQYYAGDGLEYRFGLGGGLPLGERGNLSASMEMGEQEITARQVQRPDAIAFQAANPNIQVPDPVQRWGQPEESRVRGSLSASYDLSDRHHLYAFGMAQEGDGVTDFNWRNPATTGNVFRDTTVFPGFNFSSIYPAGFTPRFGTEFSDYQIAGGVRGDLTDNLTYDLGLSQGESRAAFTIGESLNASMGPDSPTDFFLGREILTDFVANADFVYRLPLGDREPLNIGFGLEHRIVTYEVEAGDEASWKIGPGAAFGLAAGSNGFVGYEPSRAGEWDATGSAAYIDLEWRPVPILTLGVAGRYEDHDAFGDTFNYRLAARLEPIEGFAIRGTYSTGFRAPDPHQLYSSKTSQGLNTGTGNIESRGRLQVDDPIAIALGAKALEPETSRNTAFGVVYRNTAGLTLSLDWYRIETEGRITGSNSFAIPAGMANPYHYTSINYYRNGYQTNVEGLDLTASYRRDVGLGTMNASLSFNHNAVDIVDDGVGSISDNEAFRAEKRIPDNNASASLSYQVGKFMLSSRLRYYGEWTEYADEALTGNRFQDFGSTVYFNLSAGYDFDNGARLLVGAENLFDTYPDKATDEANRGLIYSRRAPFDTDGGQYFLRLGYNF